METPAVSPRETRLPVLDTTRGVAILLVFLFHGLTGAFQADHLAWAGWHRAWPFPLSFLVLFPAYLGWAGVAMFFTVSGFCIHLSHVRSGEAGYRAFFVRRFFRIYPPYLAALLFFSLLFPLTRLGFHSRHEIDQFISHLLLFHNLIGPGFFYGVNASFWSIAVEVQLYLLYPFLLALVGKVGWARALVSIGVVEAALRIVWWRLDAHPPVSYWVAGVPLMYGFSWGIGAALADDFMHGRPLFPGRWPLWFWPALAAAAYFTRFTQGFGFPLWSLATAAVLARRLSSPARKDHPAFWARHLRQVGVISYSIYLIHQPLEETIAQAVTALVGNHSWAVYAGTVLSWPLILLIAWGFYHAAELPAIAMGKRLLRTSRARPWVGARAMPGRG